MRNTIRFSIAAIILLTFVEQVTPTVRGALHSFSGFVKKMFRFTDQGRDKGIENSEKKFQEESLGLDADKKKGFFGKAVDEIKNHIHLIVPGTLWCGSGNTSNSDEALGHFRKADACCREHDHCGDTILAGQKRGELTNTGSFTRSNCECDTKFYNCLKSADTIPAKKVGFTYFTVLGPQCFSIKQPKLECIKTKGRYPKRCVKYKYDESKPPRLQWFDNPTF